MIVVYRESQKLKNSLDFFRVSSPTELPFVDNTLGNISVAGWRALEPETTFYLPQNWTHFDDGSGSFVFYDDITQIQLNGEFTVFTELGILPVKIPSKEDLHPKDVMKSTSKDISFGIGFKSMRDFLTVGHSYISESILTVDYSLEHLADIILSSIGAEKSFVGDSPVYSGPAIVDDMSTVSESEIFGPCLIVNSTVVRSKIYPGSVLINSHVSDSEVKFSYLDNTKVLGSTVSGVTAYTSSVVESGLVNSILPKLTQVKGK